MTSDQDEIARRKRVALDAIRQSCGTDAGEFAATLFASHHLHELGPSYWETHLNTSSPQPIEVFKILRLKSHWSEDDEEGIDVFDFGLPGDVSDYVLSVTFDEDGDVEDISMES